MDGTVLRGVQKIIMEDCAGQNVAVMKRKSVISFVDACKDWPPIVHIMKLLEKEAFSSYAEKCPTTSHSRSITTGLLYYSFR